MEFGAQSVTTSGTIMMLSLSVYNLTSMQTVSTD